MVYDAVGEGLDPPENEGFDFDKIGATTGAASYSPTSFHKYLSSVEHVQMQLKEIGKICVEQLFALEKRFPSVKISGLIYTNSKGNQVAIYLKSLI